MYKRQVFRVSNTDSAYSTMELLADGSIGFFYEQTEQKGGYDMLFNKYSLAAITGGEYTGTK